MKRRIGLILAALIVPCTLFLGGCSTISPAMPEQTPESARVYIMQPSSTANLVFGALAVGTKFQLWDNDTWLGLIGSNDYIVYYAAPGIHYFMVRGQNWSIVKADLLPGKTYYLRTIDVPGFFNVSVKMEPVDPQNPELQGWIDGSKEIVPKGKAGKSMVSAAKEALEKAQSGVAESREFPASWYN